MAETKTLVLDVVKPDGEVLSTDVDECIIPGAAGSFGVRRGHTPFIAEIGAGEIVYRIGKKESFVAVEGGFCEVRPNRVTVLAERAETAEEIDIERAEKARKHATNRLEEILMKESSEEIERVQRKLRRATHRVQVAAKRAGISAESKND